MSLYELPYLNPIVILSVKSSIKTYTSSYHLVSFLIPSISVGNPSVYIDKIFMSVNTDGDSNEKNLVGKYQPKITTEKIHQ